MRIPPGTAIGTEDTGFDNLMVAEKTWTKGGGAADDWALAEDAFMKHTRSEASFKESIVSETLLRWSGSKIVYRDGLKQISCKSTISGGRAWYLSPISLRSLRYRPCASTLNISNHLTESLDVFHASLVQLGDSAKMGTQQSRILATGKGLALRSDGQIEL